MYSKQLSIIILLYFFLHQQIFPAACNSPGFHYQPPDQIAVNCGCSGNSTAEDGRRWVGDIGSNYVTSHGSRGNLKSSTAIDQPLSHDQVPYKTARLSRRPFAYAFRVTPGQKFIRLHFYPASYRGFKRSKAFFTVKAGPYTLLSNFSASLTADALGTQSLAKEFCVTVEENQQLIITFSPTSGGTSSDVYAFVNGIEIISMPVGLYHTPEGDPGAHVVGKNYRFSIDKGITLEMVYRLNMGGVSISSMEDVGMFREWSEDLKYLMVPSVWPVATTIRIKYTGIPSYIAPQKVYQTSWSMIQDKKDTNTLKFTWKLPVDLGFRYLVRLHFCELEYEIKESGHKEFSIYVNDQVAEAKADIIKWSGGSGVAVYRDYVVMMEGDRMEGKSDLLISLCPHYSHNHDWSEPIDAVLEGLEVFKLSNPDKNLAGVNPMPLALASTSPKPQKSVFASGGNAIAAVVVILLSVLNIIVYHLRILGENTVEKNLSSPPSKGLCRQFSLAEVLSVTNNFDDELVIGSGGFGKVYKALIDDGATAVALKRLNLKSKQGAKEFWTEIEMLSNLRHTHLVSLIGYCDEHNEMILVYDYMEHGTLADHLYKTNTSGDGAVFHMSWEQRLNICIGAARGLDYLHTGTRHGIIHRDVKTTNILLDKDWETKISDFGLCKVGPTSHSCTHVSTDVKGTFGYLDPEYFLTRRLTKKSDVYAFGVVMLEMLCGRPAVDAQVDEEQRSLVIWAQQCIKEKKLDQLIDPSLRDQVSPRCLKAFAEVANKCLNSRPSGRPTMADVVVSLSLDCSLPSEDQNRVPSTELEEEEDDLDDDDDDFNVGGAVDEQFDESTQKDHSRSPSTAPSSSTPVQYSENTQSQMGSKGKLSKVLQRSVEFFGKGVDIRWKKKKVYDSNNGLSLMAGGSNSRRLQWRTATLGFRRFSNGNSRPANSRFLAARGGDEVYLNGQILPSPDLRIFSFLELKKATRNFRPDRLVGVGGFGNVYKGWLDEKVKSNNGSRLAFAVKQLSAESMQGFEEWQSEINFLGRLSHPNLIKLLGYCWEDKELLLVYEFMQKGTLENHLFARVSAIKPLPWDVRLKILIGAARGMTFLHSSQRQVIYRDFKTSNILLDGSYNAKISDFGLAKLGPSASQTHVSTRIIGTYGYAAPEYVATGHLYVKSDVYGFGVVLVEILTGLRAIDISRPNGKQNLVDWCKPYLSSRRKLIHIMDSRLEGKYPPKAALIIAQVALQCLRPDPKTRPSMEEVVETLERIDTSNEYN